MSILLLLLPLLIQGCTGQLFSVEPQAEYVVRQGDSVTLECVAHSKVASRTWKVRNTELGVDGFFLKPIPPNLGIVARHPDSDTDNSITLTNVDMRYDGQYICSPFTLNGVQEDAQVANVIVAQKPVSLSFNDRLSGFSELTADVQRPAVVSCEAREARPAASIAWYLGNQQLYDGVDDEVEVVEVVSSGGDRALSTTRSTLTHRFIEADDGNVLRCVASHAGYDDQDVHETSIVVNVQYAPYRPKGNDVGTIYGFTEGQEGRIIINFTANPQPQLMEWKMGENLSVPTGARSVDGRFTANDLEPLEGENNMYALSLLIKPILREDRFAEFSLVLENRIGRSALNFNLGTGPAPPPQGLSPGALGGIVVLVLLLLIVVALVAFARSRGKWCFAAPAISKRQESRATIDPELAISSSSLSGKNRHHQNPGHDNPAAADDTVAGATTPPSLGGATKNGKLPTDTPV